MRSEHVVPLALVAIAAFLNAHAASQIIGAELAADARALAAPPPAPPPAPEVSPPSRSARPILERNPFDHATGSLSPRPPAHARDAGTSRAAAGPSSAPPAADPPIAASAPPSLVIERAVVEKMLEDQAALSRQAKAVPVREEGRVVGVRLSGIRADGLLGRLGLQNGDEVRTVNGLEVGTPDKALEAYARLATATRLTVQLRRGGSTVHLSYTVQ